MKPFFLGSEDIKRYVAQGRFVVAVYGLGGVGLAVAAVWLRHGARVIGVDVDRGKVDMINDGDVPHPEGVVRDAVRAGLREGRFKATYDGVWASRNADIMDVIVPLVYGGGGPDFSALDSAVGNVAKGLSRGDVVIVETSLPPGTTEGRVREVLEGVSGLVAGEDFGLIYSPERVMIGHAVEDIEVRYPKIVSGIGAKSLEVGEAIYSLMCRAGVVKVSSPRVAEFEKLAEGVYRDVNIALANELARLSRLLGVDFDEVIEAANSQPYSHIHRPGVGVGGLCIPVYPRLLEWVAESLGVRLELVSLARGVNDFQPMYISSLVAEGLSMLGSNIRGSRVALLGDAFRGDVGVTALTPTHVIARSLMDMGAEVVVHDPYVKRDEYLSRAGARLSSDLKESLAGCEAVVVSTDHSIYKELSTCDILDMCSRREVVIVDGKHVLRVERCGGRVLYTGSGRPWTRL